MPTYTPPVVYEHARSGPLNNFDGATYDHARDGKRLGAQMEAVFDVMKNGNVRTLPQLAEITGYPESSISARLRDLRKPKFGGHRVDREYLGRGLWSYRLVLQEEGLS